MKQTVRIEFKDGVMFLYIDLLCGAGGTTYALLKAIFGGAKIAKVIACVNHDRIAIESHWSNHPEVKHFEEDIRKLSKHLKKLVKLVKHWKALYPAAFVVLWASLECTNFSKAKEGGQPRDADSRTLAYSLLMQWHEETKKYVKGDSYIQLLDPDYIMIENVVEFMSWGPMRIKAKTVKASEGVYAHSILSIGKDKETKEPVYLWEPLSKRNGIDWLNWCKAIDDLGYHNEWKELNSANFGARTSRNRLFGIFAKTGLPIAWPAPTHAKDPEKFLQKVKKNKKPKQVDGWVKTAAGWETAPTLFPEYSGVNALQRWQPVRDCLNFDDKGESIFNRKKPLVDATLERIYAGLIKFVAKGDTSFISKYYSGRPAGKVISTDGPAGTITTVDSQCLVQPVSLLKYNSKNGKTNKHVPPSLDEPSPVIPCQGRLGLIQAEYIIQRNGDNPDSRIVDLDGPARTITATGGNQELVQPINFITMHYSTGENVCSVENPLPTIPTKDRFTVVSTEPLPVGYLLNYNHSSDVNDVDKTAPTITAADKLGLAQPEFFIDKHYGKQQNQSINDPAGAILPTDKHRLVEVDPFIMDTNFNNGPQSLDQPAGTITASRHWPYLLNPSYGGNLHDVEQPCPVIVARQDKAPLKLLIAEEGLLQIPIYDTDTPIMVKIKEFMIVYRLKDILMRMLRIRELLAIQGFPATYILKGAQDQQKKCIGNSVNPQTVKVWVEALAEKIYIHLQKMAA